MRKYFSSLQTRLLTTYVGLIVIGFGGLTLLAGRQLAQNAYQDFANNLEVNAILVATALVEPLEDEFEGEDVGSLAGLVTQYADRTNASITVLNREGEVIAYSDESNQTISINTPELVSASNNEVIYQLRNDAQGNATVYTAAPILYENYILGYAHLASSAAIPQTAVRQRWLALSSGFILFATIGLITSLWLSRTLTYPIFELRNTSLKLAQGDLDQRAEEGDIEEIQALANAFNQMADQVQAIIEEQRAFASNASHELRTPLTTIQLRTESILNDPIDSDTKDEYILEIDGEVKRLSNLVSDLLLLSRIDAKRFAVGAEQVDAKRLLNTVVATMIPTARAKTITLTTSIPAETLYARTNMTHLRVVLRNLVENAIKYTPPEGNITCHLSQEGDFIKVAISDSGQGMTATDIPLVTKRFYRTDKAHSRRIMGTGLGLALVQSITTIYGGNFKLESPGEGLGTTATIWWPAATT